MYPQSPHLPELMRDRFDALLREAEVERQLAEAYGAPPGVLSPLLRGVGDGLVAAGEWLRQRAEHPPASLAS